VAQLRMDCSLAAHAWITPLHTLNAPRNLRLHVLGSPTEPAPPAVEAASTNLTHQQSTGMESVCPSSETLNHPSTGLSQRVLHIP